MPLGVEHTVATSFSGSKISVPLPLMPLGVEHWNTGGPFAQAVQVPLPLMPLGVEHITTGTLQDAVKRKRAFTFDAFRR